MKSCSTGSAPVSRQEEKEDVKLGRTSEGDIERENRRGRVKEEVAEESGVRMLFLRSRLKAESTPRG